MNGRSYGEAPVTVSIPRGKQSKIEFRLRGYKVEAFAVDGSTPAVHRSLKLKEMTVDPALKPPDDDGLATPSAH